MSFALSQRMRCVQKWVSKGFLFLILGSLNQACDSASTNESLERIQRRSDLGVNTGNSILPSIQSVRITVDGSEGDLVQLGSVIECEVIALNLREGDQSICSMEFYTTEGVFLGKVENDSIIVGRTHFELPSEFIIVANASLWDPEDNLIDEQDYSDRFTIEDMESSGSYHSPGGSGAMPKLSF